MRAVHFYPPRWDEPVFRNAPSDGCGAGDDPRQGGKRRNHSFLQPLRVQRHIVRRRHFASTLSRVGGDGLRLRPLGSRLPETRLRLDTEPCFSFGGDEMRLLTLEGDGDEQL